MTFNDFNWFQVTSDDFEWLQVTSSQFKWLQFASYLKRLWRWLFAILRASRLFPLAFCLLFLPLLVIMRAMLLKKILHHSVQKLRHTLAWDVLTKYPPLSYLFLGNRLVISTRKTDMAFFVFCHNEPFFPFPPKPNSWWLTTVLGAKDFLSACAWLM